MKINTLIFLILICFSCKKDEFRNETSIPEFNFPQSIIFEEKLSSYGIFAGDPSNLKPSNDFHLIELTSVLYTDHAFKQRLIKVPNNALVTKQSGETLSFPDETILVKTFYYYNDARDTSLGKRIIESRLLIKEMGVWNIATYLWNQDQTDATLINEGAETSMNWINEDGKSYSTNYQVPSQNECMTCHQSNAEIAPIGPSLRNINRIVVRDGLIQNQIEYLQSINILNHFSVNSISEIVDYNDLNINLETRARAYMDMNCAHCHNPSGWDKPAEREFDFRYETSITETGIKSGKNKIINSVAEGKMPLIGTTIVDQEGAALIVDYIKSL
ncbi:MAG: hypothetical protein MRY83_24635 [Flavobacteriales bacterium]|nr:hypothetical protein [Flavobacteriales bacterium]